MRQDEALYVVAGTLLVQIGDDQTRADGRDFRVGAPRHPAYVRQRAGTAVRAINISVPGGLEGLFAEQGEYFAHLHGAPDVAELGRMGARDGSRLLGAPITAVGAPGQPSS